MTTNIELLIELQMIALELRMLFWAIVVLVLTLLFVEERGTRRGG